MEALMVRDEMLERLDGGEDPVLISLDAWRRKANPDNWEALVANYVDVRHIASRSCIGDKYCALCEVRERRRKDSSVGAGCKFCCLGGTARSLCCCDGWWDKARDALGAEDSTAFGVAAREIVELLVKASLKEDGDGGA